ncbi:MAG: hypothetical protein KAS53_11540 [Candidatus Cloacimonetes bacterium]|nr:hypothetical protein [Candidatus Cloacimonadota bacterium]
MIKIRIFSAATIIMLVILTMTMIVSADEPPRSPWKTMTKSPDGSKCVISDPETNITTVYEIDDKTGNKLPLWSIVGWFRVTHISNDGEHLVIGYDGMNLLPFNYWSNEPMLYFIHKGELIKHVTLDQLIKDPSKMTKAVSHYAWGNYVGFDDKGHFVVETCEGKRVFDPKTGEHAKTK